MPGRTPNNETQSYAGSGPATDWVSVCSVVATYLGPNPRQ